MWEGLFRLLARVSYDSLTCQITAARQHESLAWSAVSISIVRYEAIEQESNGEWGNGGMIVDQLISRH